jgi:hypothetical protein
VKPGSQPPCLRSPDYPEPDEEALEVEQHAELEEENDDVEPEQEDDDTGEAKPEEDDDFHYTQT